MNFVPLYVFSEYSILQSTCHLSRLVEKLKERHISACAITDFAVTHGLYKFYNLLKKNHIKPLLGVCIEYKLNHSTSRILLYAKNIQGYHNLLKISSIAKINKKPIELDQIKKYTSNLLGVTAGSDSVVYDMLRHDDTKSLIEHYNYLKSYFDIVYFGLSSTAKESAFCLNHDVSLLTSVNIPSVLTNHLAMIEKTDIDAFQILKSINNNNVLTNVFETEKNAYFDYTLENEMLYQSTPVILNNMIDIVNQCNVDLSCYDGFHLPVYNKDLDAASYLRDLAFRGLKKRLEMNQIQNPAKYFARFDYEYQTIIDMGFADYFLIVWDYVKYAKKNNIQVSHRGSAGASLIAYALGITEIDPLQYNLLFERFLNRERITMPDIDMDIEGDERKNIIDYVVQKYGKSHVAQIATFGTFQTKSALNDVSDIYKTNDKILKQVLKIIEAANPSRDELEEPKTLNELINSNEQLIQIMNDYEEVAKLVKTSAILIDLPRNLSTHAAGIIICGNPLTNYTAIDEVSEGIYQTQYDAGDLESLGLLKMDFLALNNLTNVRKTYELIKKDNHNFVLPKTDNDQAVYRLISSGDVTGLFQLESAGIRRVVMDMKVSSFSDLVSVLALYRPGPKDNIKQFIDCKFGRVAVEYPHDDLKDILKETYGIIVYQEQIMMIAQKFAGYSLGKADVLRRAVSKKKLDVLEKERQLFVTSSVNQGYSEIVANKIYDYIVKFANYGFNKAHAVAYAKLTYLTAYLKCHYPEYYLSVLADSLTGSGNEMEKIIKEAKSKKIKIYTPRINSSLESFKVYPKSILLPLTMVKGIGEAKAKELILEREKGKFESFKDFMNRTKDIFTLEQVMNLINAGALVEFKLTKKAMTDNAKLILDMGEFEGLPGLREIVYSTEEFTYGELLEREKDALGININYSIFNQYERLYQMENLIHLKDIQANMQVRTLGIIKKIKVITTKNNEEMIFATLADGDASMELTIFPRTLKSIPELKENMIVIVYGKSEERKGLQLIVDFVKLI